MTEYRVTCNGFVSEWRAYRPQDLHTGLDLLAEAGVTLIELRQKELDSQEQPC